jgi:hypothetical protein
MASASKSKGSVRTVQWWDHLREWKRPQNKRVRCDGKQIIEQFWIDEEDDPQEATSSFWEQWDDEE